MDVPVARKRRLVRQVLDELSRQFTLVPMGAHAAEALARERLPVVEPVARSAGAFG
jgi:hypothetical protein